MARTCRASSSRPTLASHLGDSAKKKGRGKRKVSFAVERGAKEGRKRRANARKREIVKRMMMRKTIWKARGNLQSNESDRLVVYLRPN